jgi:hypothetical protein
MTSMSRSFHLASDGDWRVLAGVSADLPAGCTRDEAETDGRLRLSRQHNMAILQEIYGSDGTRTRDLRRDRPAF